MKEQMIEIGQIVNTHGIKGEVKVMPFADGPEFFYEIDDLLINGNKYEIKTSRTVKNCVLLTLRGIDSIEQAQGLKGKTVYINKDQLPELPEGVYYIRDLIGLKVIDKEQNEIGVVNDILQTGANDVYVISKPDKTTICLPKIPQCIKEINLDKGYILAEIMEGLE